MAVFCDTKIVGRLCGGRGGVGRPPSRVVGFPVVCSGWLVTGLAVPLPRARWHAMEAKLSRRWVTRSQYGCIRGVAKAAAHWAGRRGSGTPGPPTRALPSPSIGVDGLFSAPPHYPFLLRVRHSCIWSFPTLTVLLPPPPPADSWRSATSTQAAPLRYRSMRGSGA